MGRVQNHLVGTQQRAAQDRSLTREGALGIVLLHPRIPQNTGSIARMCAATGSRLDLIAPFFRIDDSKLKRAGLDYWHLLDVRQYESFEEWKNDNPQARAWFVEVSGEKLYSEARFSKGDFLFFGDEQDGISKEILLQYPGRGLRIPQQGVRSMNQAMCAGIVCFEALRQVSWLGLC